MRVLIVRTGAMGDVVHALHAAAALRRARPEWTVDWVVDERWSPLLADDNGERPDRGPMVSRVYAVPLRRWSAKPFSAETRRSVWSTRHMLQEGRYDLAVDLQGTIRSAVIGRMARAKEFAGWADPRETPARWIYRRRFARTGRHIVEQGTALLGMACGVELVPARPELPCPPRATAWARARTEALCGGGRTRLAVLAPGAGWRAKQWPAERYGLLATALAAQGYAVVVNAVGAQDRLAAEVVRASAGAATALPCSLAEMIALLRQAALFVGGDSGPTHVAAALGVPLVALYGPTDPARNGPWGDGPMRVLRDAASATSHKRVATVDPGLERLAVEQVLEAVASLPAHGAAAGLRE